MAEFLVKLAHPPGFRVHVEKLKAQQAIENLVCSAAVVLNRGLDHFNDSGLFTDANSASFLGAVVEFLQFSIAPLTVNVAGGDNGNHQLGLVKCVDYLLVEDVRAGEFLVSPNIGILSKQLTQANLEGAMELADPALLTLRQRFVVHMGVTNKNIIHESVNVLNPSRGINRKKTTVTKSEIQHRIVCVE